jgi:CBS domain-containing membrane protein
MQTTMVKDIMSSPVEILQVGDSLDLAQRLMAAGHIRHLPVVDGEQRLVGLITQRKLLGAWVSHGHPARERPGEVARGIPVEMLMEKDVVTTWPGAPASDAASLIETRKIGCLPVLDDGKVVGIVTGADFVRFARRFLERENV